jgi:predicted PhzF superfamily epimerase YddE/YHI9
MTVQRLFQVDAFADAVFRGNPAAVCPLQSWLDEQQMQAIAQENNLSETAFFVPRDGVYDLRWFTPRAEVDLCGHATLASAFVLFSLLDHGGDVAPFETRSGRLEVRRDGDLLVMDFPSLPPTSCSDPPAALLAGLPARPSIVVQSAFDYIAVYDEAETVRSLQPDLTQLETLESRGVVVTAPGDEVDFVSRYFAPRFGIPEDPVTGSTHSTLVPYWAERLGKSSLHARQLSQRGGELFCKALGERVEIAGRCALYLDGTICL